MSSMSSIVDCDLCDTNGEVPFEWIAQRLPNDPEYFVCPRCDGEGSHMSDGTSFKKYPDIPYGDN